jgi:hypothetical protein
MEEWILASTIKKVRERLKNASGEYDVIHRETEGGLVNLEDGSNAQAHVDSIAFSQNGVHGFRYNGTESTFEVYNPETGEWEDISTGGGGLAPLGVANIAVVAGSGKVYLKWTDPDDTVIDGVALVTWAGTKLVRKAGSFPASVRDGVEILDSKSRNAYQSSYFADSGLTNGVTYYYQFFPYSTDKVVNGSETNRASATPSLVAPGNVSNITAVSSGDSSIDLKWTDPDPTVWLDGILLATWAGTKVVYKTDSYPEDEDDGVVAKNSTTRNEHAEVALIVSGLDNDTEYYFAFFPYSTEGAVNMSESNRASAITGRIVISGTPSQMGELMYYGAPLTPEWDNYDPNQLTIGGTASATNAGTYTATFTPKPGHQWSDGTTTPKSVNWVIGRGNVDAIPNQNGTLTYTGYGISPSWDNYDTAKLTVNSDGLTATDAGIYGAWFTPTSNYRWFDGTTEPKLAEWTINRASIPAVPTQSGSLTFTGSLQSPSWSGYDSAKLTIGGTTEGVDPGFAYQTTFTPTANYQWFDGTTAAKTATWTINRAVIAATPTQSGTLTYTGSSLSPSWNNYNTAQLTIGGATSAINAGTYTATFTPTGHYQWSDETTTPRSANWTVGRASIAATPSQSGTLTYTNSAQSPSWSNYNTAQLTIGGTTSSTNAGTYTATFTPTSNYQWSDGTTASRSVYWTINKAVITTTPSQSGSLTYTGSTLSPSWSNHNSAQLTMGGTTSAVDAGTYAATFTPTANYQWSDGTTAAKSVNWIVYRASGSLSINPTSITLEPANPVAYITVTRAGDGAITAVSSDTSVASCSVSGTTVTISSVNDMLGTATITVSVAQGTNHNAPSNATCAVSAQFYILNNMSWAAIKQVVDAGQAMNYWAVGDCKAVTLNDTVVGSASLAGTYYCFIIDFNYSVYGGAGDKIYFQFGKTAPVNGIDIAFEDGTSFKMNSGTDKVGWEGSYMRNTICPAFQSALPVDLQSILSPVTNWTDNWGFDGGDGSQERVRPVTDTIFLLAEKEVFGTKTYANQFEASHQSYYMYYKNGNSRIKYKHNQTGTKKCWWLRSPGVGGFCMVNTSGSISLDSSTLAYGFAPCFCV